MSERITKAENTRLLKRLAEELKIRMEYQDIVYKCCILVDAYRGEWARTTVSELVSMLEKILKQEDK